MKESTVELTFMKIKIFFVIGLLTLLSLGVGAHKVSQKRQEEREFEKWQSFREEWNVKQFVDPLLA